MPCSCYFRTEKAFFSPQQIVICLFKEVINLNPFTSEGAESIEERGKVGENMALALGLPNAISARKCKQKVQAQVGYFRADDTKTS